MNKLIISIILLTLSFGTFAEPSKRESIEELLKITNVDAMIEGIYSQMDQVYAGMAKQLGVKPSEQEAFDDYMQNVAAEMKKEMNWEKMKEPMIDIYVKHYSEKEVQDMLAFYRTETGQSVITKMPEVMGDSMILSQEMMKGFFPKLKAMVQEFREKLIAKRKES